MNHLWCHLRIFVVNKLTSLKITSVKQRWKINKYRTNGKAGGKTYIIWQGFLGEVFYHDYHRLCWCACFWYVVSMSHFYKTVFHFLYRIVCLLQTLFKLISTIIYFPYLNQFVYLFCLFLSWTFLCFNFSILMENFSVWNDKIKFIKSF